MCQFLNRQRGFAIPSSAAFGKIGQAYVAEVHSLGGCQWPAGHSLRQGENKERIARPLLDAAAAEGGDGRVVLNGIAQEKAPVWRSWKAKGQEHASHPHRVSVPELGEALQASGLDEGAARFAAALDLATAREDLDTASDDLARLIGRAPTPLIDVTRAAMAQVETAAWRSSVSSAV